MNRPFGLPGDGPVKRYEQREATGWLPRGWIDGLTLANDGTDAANDISISAGVCRSTVNIVEGEASTMAKDQRDIEIPASIIKQLDVAWAPENYDPDGYSGGGRSGMLNPLASISNTTWHVYAVGGGDCQDDIMAIASATQATVLDAIVAAGGFTAYRLIGSILRESAAIVGFIQRGDDFYRKVPILDVSAAGDTTSAASRTLSVPTGINVKAYVGVYLVETDANTIFYLSSLDTTDTAATVGVTGGAGTTSSGGIASTSVSGGIMSAWTNTSAQVRTRSSASQTLSISSLGWMHPRGRNS